MKEQIKSREEFIQFVEELRDDLHRNPNEWENNTLDRFLEAMSAYASDVQGYYNNTSQKVNADVPSWQVFADILMGAKVYE